MKLDMKPRGFTADGSGSHLYVMENQKGLRIAVSDYGGTVTKNYGVHRLHWGRTGLPASFMA